MLEISCHGSYQLNNQFDHCFSDIAQIDSFITGIHQATATDMLLPTASVHLRCPNTTVRGSRREARIVSDPSQTDFYFTGIHQATTADMLLPTASVHLWCSNTSVRGSRREARIVESIPGRRGASDIYFFTYKVVPRICTR